jgi:hypothetical protein
MIRDKKEAEEEKLNNRCALYKIVPPSALREPESKETTEQEIAETVQEIAETIQNNSKIGRGRAMEILEIMKDNQVEIQWPTKEKSKRKKKRKKKRE